MFRAWTFTVNILSKVENLIQFNWYAMLHTYMKLVSFWPHKIDCFHRDSNLVLFFCFNPYSLVSSNCGRLVLVQFQNLISFFYMFLIVNIVFISQLLLSTCFHYKSLHLPPWAESKNLRNGREMVKLRAKMLHLLSLIQNIISRWFCLV